MLKTLIIIWINNLGHPLSFGKWYSHVLLWLVASQLYFWWNPSWKWSPEPCSAHERKLEGPTEDQTLSTEGTWHVFWFSVQCNTGNMGYGQLDTWPARVKYFFRKKLYMQVLWHVFINNFFNVKLENFMLVSLVWQWLEQHYYSTIFYTKKIKEIQFILSKAFP